GFTSHSRLYLQGGPDDLVPAAPPRDPANQPFTGDGTMFRKAWHGIFAPLVSLGTRAPRRQARQTPQVRLRVETLEGRIAPAGDFGFPIGFGNAFVAKLDANGNTLWARALVGPQGTEYGYGVAVDGTGNVYTIGDFAGTVDFNPGPGSAPLTATGDVDVFVSKLDAGGNFVWARALDGWHGAGVAVDGTGHVYLTGSFRDTLSFAPPSGSVTLTSAGQTDVFVAKL